MRMGFLPQCGMDARGDSQSRGRWRIAWRGNRAIWPARVCSVSSVLKKAVYFCGGGVGAVVDFSCEILFRHASLL